MPVQSLTWIAEWAFSCIHTVGHKYFQVDASFYALSPYVYFIPLLIIDNASLPLGISIGPSEHQNLFLDFFEFIEKNDFSFHLNSYKILSDGGNAIRSFADTKKCQQFFCYRHLLENVGSNSALGVVTRRLLFQPSQEHYISELNQSISDANCFLKNNLVNPTQLKKFINIFNFALSSDNLIQVREFDHPHGLWKRANFGISTCSNHIERLHRTLNQKVSLNQSILSRLSIVFSELHEYYIHFEENSRRQALYVYKKLQKNAEKNNYYELDNYYELKACPFDCKWGEIYSHRFGIDNFPCTHHIYGTNIEFKNIKISSEILNSIEVHFSAQYEDWSFPEKKFRFKIRPFTNLEEDPNQTQNDTTSKGFVFQTVSEIHLLKNKKIPKCDLLFEITMEWARKTSLMDELQTHDVEFRSEFRLKMLKKYLKEK